MATAKKSTSTKAKKSSGYQSKKELPEDKQFCNCCGKLKVTGNFYNSTSFLNKGTGYMPICKDCCNELFESNYREFKRLEEWQPVCGETITWTLQTEKAFDKTCRLLNLKFDYSCYEQTKSHIESLKNNGTNAKSIFGIYKSKLSSTGKKNGGFEDLTYDFSDEVKEDCKEQAKIRTDSNKNDMTEEDVHKMQMFWGKGLTRDDYEFLETELADWRESHKCDNKADLTLLKEICLKELDLRKAREEGKDVDKLQTGLQNLMKTASVDPSKSSSINSQSKASDSYGAWVKDTETMTPAEWHDKQEKYKDMDGLTTYLTNFVKRPILNFLSGTRNFELVGEKFDGKLDEEKDGE